MLWPSHAARVGAKAPSPPGGGNHPDVAATWVWRGYRNSPEMRLTEPATMTTPNT